MAKILPVLLVVLGVLGGAGIGFVMKPEPELDPETIAAMEAEKAEQAADEAHGSDHTKAEEDSEYMELSRKLIVPITSKEGTKAFVALDLHLELAPDQTPHAQAHEPKLRDAFLRTLIAFGSTGAFDQHAHTTRTLRELGRALLKVAREVLGDDAVRNVLIGDLIKQER
ncbi:MAG: flagellar basal body-associated FliL family protein [Pseudomonadota bacterium]